jgi:hypothetical protein
MKLNQNIEKKVITTKKLDQQHKKNLINFKKDTII